MEKEEITIYGMRLVDGPDVTDDNNYIWWASGSERNEKALKFLRDGYTVAFYAPYKKAITR